jgi:hypothetical protein
LKIRFELERIGTPGKLRSRGFVELRESVGRYEPRDDHITPVTQPFDLGTRVSYLDHVQARPLATRPVAAAAGVHFAARHIAASNANIGVESIAASPKIQSGSRV